MEVVEHQIEAKNSSDAIKLDLADIEKNILFIIKGVELTQPRLIQKAIRQNVSIRKHINAKLLRLAINKFVPVDYPTYQVMVNLVDKLPNDENTNEDKMDVVEDSTITHLTTASSRSCVPEVEVYIFTLVVTTLLRHDFNADAAFGATALMERLSAFNRRTLDLLSSKAYVWFSFAYEKLDRLEHIRSALLNAYRTCSVRHDEMGQAVLLNLLLRNYLHYNLVEQAHILSMRATFPENVSNNQFCRYLYYMGRILAVELEYSDSYRKLTVAARKAPQGYATGFTLKVTKLSIIVQLLMGEIPERSIFNTKELRGALKPYLVLTKAVRNGDIVEFQAAMSTYQQVFAEDHNDKLIQRLAHNVLKIGLRKLSVSYSRISLADIAAKLHLPSAASAEYVCAKAIRDGVIDAKIDHENGWVSSSEALDIYSSAEPQTTFHKRIAFCLDVHNEAVKSMRYPPESIYKKELNGDKKGHKSDEKTIEELIKEMEDDLDE